MPPNNLPIGCIWSFLAAKEAPRRTWEEEGNGGVQRVPRIRIELIPLGPKSMQYNCIKPLISYLFAFVFCGSV